MSLTLPSEAPMNHRSLFKAPGGPEVLEWVEAPLAPPGPGQARVRHTAIGVNYIDIYHRSGAYPVPLPDTLGLAAGGGMEALGAGVAGLEVGQRVAYVDGPTGAYAEARNHPVDRLVPLPGTLSDEDAAALLSNPATPPAPAPMPKPGITPWIAWCLSPEPFPTRTRPP